MTEIFPLISRQVFDPRYEPLTPVFSPGSPVGETSQAIMESLSNLSNNHSSMFIEPGKNFFRSTAPIEEQLFDSLASAKIFTAQVAMHLNKDIRDKLFKQLDKLLDAEEWDEKDKPLVQSSYTTFLRMILFLQPTKLPSLGMTYNGNLIAAWANGDNRLSIECMANDSTKWVLSHYTDGERESAAGISTLARLPYVLSPYNAVDWIRNDATALAA